MRPHLYRFLVVLFVLLSASLTHDVAASGPASDPFNAVLISPQRLEAIKAKIKAGEEPWTSAYRRLLRDANAALSKIPLSVVDNGGPAGGGNDRHKFGTDHPTATRANRDDYRAAVSMGNWVRDLGLAYAFTGDDRYASKAVDLLYHWAVNPATRMVPSTENFSPHRAGSSRKKQNSIELYIALPQMFYGASLVAGHRRWAQKGSGAESAFKTWSQTLMNHADRYYGGYKANNIYAWWLATRASIAAFLGDRARLDRAFSDWKATAIDQIDPKGKMERELDRTDALGYSLYAMKALTITASIAANHGVDLYGYRDGKGGSALKRALDYHAPYVINPKAWPHAGSGARNMDGDAATYELAHSYWQERRYLDVVSRNGRPLKDSRVAGITTLTHANLFKLKTASQPRTGQVKLLSPTPQQTFRAPASITLEASTEGFAPNATTVAYFANGVQIGQSTSAPYRFVWKDVAPGSYTFTATASDRNGVRGRTSGGTEVLVSGRAGGGIASTPVSKLSVERVQARSSQKPNVAGNVLDGKLATRWSAKGKGQWIQFNLGSLHRVSEVRIAWHEGNTRQARFDIKVSKDGAAWTQVHRGTSSGKTTGFERVTFSSKDAKFVRIVGRGNTRNNWNSINEVEIFGRDAQAAAKVATADQLEGVQADLQTSETAEPAMFELSQNYPNPVQSATTITYRLPGDEHVTLEIYDMTGRRIQTLVNGHRASGQHDVEWDGRDAAGQRVASGVYFYQIAAGSQRQSRTMTLVK